MSKYIGTPVVNLSVDTVDVTGDITATDSTPELILLNDTHEDTDGGREGKVTFKGEQSGGEVTVLAQIQSGHDGTSDDQKGDLIFKTNDGSDGASPTEAMRIDSEQNLGLGTNAPAHRLDIVESANAFGARITNNSDSSQGLQVRTSDNDTGQYILDLQSSSSATGTDYASKMVVEKGGNVGVGTSSPDSLLHLSNSDATAYSDTATDGQVGVGPTIYLENPANANTTVGGQIVFGMRSTEVQARIAATGGTAPAITFGTADAERMRIDSSGKVGIGTNSPGEALEVDGVLQIDRTGDHPAMRFVEDGSNTRAYIASGDWAINGLADDDFGISSSSTGDLVFGTAAGSERMRIDSDGRIALHGIAYATYPTNNATIKIGIGGDVNMRILGYGSSHTCVQFKHNGNTTVGSIVTAASSTTYNTSSDYRLKENIQNISDGITRVKQLSPKRFNFIVDADTTVDGFLAHEAATVVPEAVTGVKDGLEVWTEKDKLPDGVSLGDNKLDDDGNTIPEYQGIDQSKLVPLLTAALQEAIAKIETLETKVAALEGE